MNRLRIAYIFILGFINIGQLQISGSTVEHTVTLGDNVTLFCDCHKSSGLYINWYRNCVHENQPTLVLKTKFPHQELSLLDKDDSFDFLNPFPRFHLVENQSSDSYDLLIVNIMGSDEGVYYCGTERFTVEIAGDSTDKYVYSYSNVTTRIKLSETYTGVNSQDCIMCWRLLFCLCPALAVFSSLLSSLLVYHLSKKTGSTVSEVDSDNARAKKHHTDEKRSETRGHTRLNQDEDVCYAALDVRQMSQKSNKKRSESSEFQKFSIYSDINTCRI